MARRRGDLLLCVDREDIELALALALLDLDDAMYLAMLLLFRDMDPADPEREDRIDPDTDEEAGDMTSLLIPLSLLLWMPMPSPPDAMLIFPSFKADGNKSSAAKGRSNSFSNML